MTGLPEGYCPHLGLEEDRLLHYSYPESAHRCFSLGSPDVIELEEQERFCLNGDYQVCPRFTEPPAPPPEPEAEEPAETTEEAEDLDPALAEAFPRFSPLRVAFWLLAGMMGVMVVFYYGSSIFGRPSEPEASGALVQQLPPTSTPMPRPTRARAPARRPTLDTASARRPTPTRVFGFVRPTPTPTPPPGASIFSLSPATNAVGWVASNEARGNHFGDSYMHVGVYGGIIYHGAVQFDLSFIPPGSPVHYAALQLTGLNRERAGRGGSWELRLLEAEANIDWPSHTFQDIHNGKVEQTIAPALNNTHLDRNKTNVFTFTPDQLAILEKRLLTDGRVSFRLDGPLSGDNNLFTWDSGYGPDSLGNRPVLIVSAGPPPLTPIPTGTPVYTIVTPTPTPENVFTAVAMVAKAKLRTTRVGTPTPLPRYMATPTPLLVVTSTPTPENAATATYIAAWATAVAMTTGTATPTPPNMVTATPTPTFVIITSVPTPRNALTAVAMAITAVAQAKTRGTPTPLLPNWVTPIVVTSTPTPENAATAQELRAMATAVALTIGTPTPTPPNVFTATPTPTFVIVTSAPTPQSVLTAMALAAAATAQATTTGTPTPMPLNWVTPIVVTSTPTPENAATAQAIAFIATAEAFTTGTATPTPPNVFTATPTPLLLDVDVNPTLTPEPTLPSMPEPSMMPPGLEGEIAFLSDREGDEPAVYVMDPDGSNVVKMSGHWAYELALQLDTFSPDRSQRVFVRTDNREKTTGKQDIQLWVQNLADTYVWTLVDHIEQRHGRGGIYIPGHDFDPAWSPDSRHIAYVSTMDGNEEIHVLDKDDRARPDRRLTINTWEADRHPSYSPDGSQIVFWSNRETERRQIWIMDANGENQRRLLESPYNDWDPVWIKWSPALDIQTPIPAATFTPAPAFTSTTPLGSVLADSLNFRAGPGLDYEIINTLPKGARLELLARNQPGDWLHVRLDNGQEGWIHAEYVYTTIDITALQIAAEIPPPPSPTLAP